MSTKITKVGVTNEKISARGGISFFLRYLEQTRLYTLISSSLFSFLVPNKKGLKLQGFLKQMFAFFIDGTDTSISGFDRRKKDDSYAALLECETKDLASSHQIKRFFIKLSVIGNLIFNKILNMLFIWRLNIE